MPVSKAAPILVSLLTPPQVPSQSRAQPERKPKRDQKPKPKPVHADEPRARPPVAAPSVLAAPQEAPAPSSSYVAPAPTPVETPAAPAVASAPTPAAAPASAPKPAPASVVPPSFNADYLQNPAPAYPKMARRMGQQGKVVLRVLVNPGGTAAQLEVRSSSGSNVLDNAALEAVRRWRFVPARQGSQPVSAWVLIPITFTLQG